MIKVECTGDSYFPICFFWRGRWRYLSLASAIQFRNNLSKAIDSLRGLVACGPCQGQGRMPDDTLCTGCDGVGWLVPLKE
jgi:hypothetical protein